MLAVERRKRIMELLSENGSVMVTDLSRRFKIFRICIGIAAIVVEGG